MQLMCYFLYHFYLAFSFLNLTLELQQSLCFFRQILFSLSVIRQIKAAQLDSAICADEVSGVGVCWLKGEQQ